MSSGARVEQRAITWSQDSRIPIKTYKNAPEHVWRLLRAYSRPNTKERWRLWLKTASLGYIVAHTTNNTKVKFQQKRLGRVPGEKAWQRYFVTESSRWSVIRNVGRSPGCLACSKRSDSGERCGVKKVMKSRVVGAPFYFAPLPTIWTPGTVYRLFPASRGI